MGPVLESWSPGLDVCPLAAVHPSSQHTLLVRDQIQGTEWANPLSGQSMRLFVCEGQRLSYYY